MPKFNENIEPNICHALMELGLKDYTYQGDDPECEAEFNERFTKIIIEYDSVPKGMDDGSGWGVECKDPSKYGVTYTEAMDKLNSLKEKYHTLQYKVRRSKEYPKVEEQLDMIWHAINSNFILRLLFGNSKWFSTIKSIKGEYDKSLS